MNADDDLLTAREAAALLRVHHKHLYRLLRQGLPGHRAGRGHWRFRREELLAWLEARRPQPGEGQLEVTLASPQASPRLLVARVRDRWVAHAAGPELPRAADALLRDGDAPATARRRVTTTRPLAELSANVLIAGCAPLLGVLVDRLAAGRARGRVHWLPSNSRDALRMLADGEVHVAGIHLTGGASESARPEDQHAAIVRRALGERAFHLVRLVRWRQGLATARRGPRRVTGVHDLQRPEIRVAARERGSGARRVLEQALASAGLRRGRLRASQTLRDHGAVAQAIALGAADAGVTIESVAAQARLRFVPLVEEVFDLVVPAELADAVGLDAMISTMSRRTLRRELDALGPHSLDDMGHVQTLRARP
ncbi:MAG: helix-turn-helix transcriptional regulator [Myxococcales bacterium]|nr:helix-turn-helix transcriptional regulator [Myxococcales bacterium]